MTKEGKIVSHSLEQIYFSGLDKDNGRSGFSILNPAQRIAFLNHYRKGVKRIFKANLKRPVVTQKEVEKVRNSIKPKPLPQIRREVPLRVWRWKYCRYVETKSVFDLNGSENLSFFQMDEDHCRLFKGKKTVIKIDTTGSEREWHQALEWTGSLPEGIYKIVLEYRILDNPQPPPDSFFYISVKEIRPSYRECGYLKWSGRKDARGRKKVVFTVTAGSVTKISFGVRFYASVEISGLKITELKEPKTVQGWQFPDYQDSHWKRLSLPKMFQKKDGILLRTSVRVGPYQRAYLKAVNTIENVQLWLNGLPLGSHWGREPFEIDLGKRLVPGSDNILCLKIDGREPSFGIAGEITLVLTGRVFIENLAVNTLCFQKSRAKVLVECQIKNELKEAFPGSLEIKIYRWFPKESRKPVAVKSLKLQILESTSKKIRKTITIPKPEPWMPEDPHLYLLRTVIRDRKGVALDDTATTFGLRKIEVLGREIYLNGKRVFLKGASDMAVWPPLEKVYLNAEAPPDECLIKDILLIKRMNGNLLRWHPGIATGFTNYVTRGFPTNYTRIAEIADYLGMFLMTGVGFWVWQSDHTQDGEYNHWFDRHVSPSIALFRNHPSIIIWEGGNENRQHMASRELVEFCDYASRKILSADKTRLVVPSSGWSHKLKKGGIQKIVQNNGGYVGFCLSNHNYPGWFSPWEEIWAKNSQRWYPLEEMDMPFLLGEFGAEAMPCWELYPDEPWYKIWRHWDGSSLSKLERTTVGRCLLFQEWEVSQAYQALVLQHLVSRVRLSKGSGTVVCTLADSQRDDGTYHKGVCDLYRIPKLGFYALKMCYQDLFVEGTAGDIVFGSKDRINPVVINNGPTRSIQLEIIIEDGRKKVIQRELKRLKLKRDSITRLDPVDPQFPKPGFYTIYYLVRDAGK